MKVNLLKSEMAKKGLTQAELAKMINISAGSINRKLTGKRDFNLSEVKQLCDILNISNPAEIFLS